MYKDRQESAFVCHNRTSRLLLGTFFEQLQCQGFFQGGVEGGGAFALDMLRLLCKSIIKALMTQYMFVRKQSIIPPTMKLCLIKSKFPRERYLPTQ